MNVKWVWGVLEVVGWVFGASGPQNRSKIDYAQGSKNLLLGRNFDFPRNFDRVLKWAQEFLWVLYDGLGGLSNNKNSKTTTTPEKYGIYRALNFKTDRKKFLGKSKFLCTHKFFDHRA